MNHVRLFCTNSHTLQKGNSVIVIFYKAATFSLEYRWFKWKYSFRVTTQETPSGFLFSFHCRTEKDFPSCNTTKRWVLSFTGDFVPWFKNLFSISCLAYQFIIYQMSAAIALSKKTSLNFLNLSNSPGNPVLACNEIFRIENMRKVYWKYAFCVTHLIGNNQLISNLVLLSTWMKEGFPPWAQRWSQVSAGDHFHRTLYQSAFHQTAARDKSPQKGLFLCL